MSPLLNKQFIIESGQMNQQNFKMIFLTYFQNLMVFYVLYDRLFS